MVFIQQVLACRFHDHALRSKAPLRNVLRITSNGSLRGSVLPALPLRLCGRVVAAAHCAAVRRAGAGLGERLLGRAAEQVVAHEVGVWGELARGGAADDASRGARSRGQFLCSTGQGAVRSSSSEDEQQHERYAAPASTRFSKAHHRLVTG